MVVNAYFKDRLKKIISNFQNIQDLKSALIQFIIFLRKDSSYYDNL